MSSKDSIDFQLSTKDKIRAWIFANAVYFFFRLFCLTWRITESKKPGEAGERFDNFEPVVFAHFHGDEIGSIAVARNWKLHTMVSHSKDGAIQDRFLRRLGFQIVRGSSSRGAARALLAIIRAVRDSTVSKRVSFAIDGPRGPRWKVKPGVFKLAEKLNAPIMAGITEVDRKWIFHKSWSKAELPKPFARIHEHYTEPITQADMKGKSIEELTEMLESRMLAVKANIGS